VARWYRIPGLGSGLTAHFLPTNRPYPKFPKAPWGRRRLFFMYALNSGLLRCNPRVRRNIRTTSSRRYRLMVELAPKVKLVGFHEYAPQSSSSNISRQSSAVGRRGSIPFAPRRLPDAQHQPIGYLPGIFPVPIQFLLERPVFKHRANDSGNCS
jgi:hypothetical protein